MTSKDEMIIGGQLTPLRMPSESLDRPAIRRIHENDWIPDRTSLIPFAMATNGGNESDDDNMANAIKQMIPNPIKMSNFDSGHFLHTKLSV